MKPLVSLLCVLALLAVGSSRDLEIRTEALGPTEYHAPMAGIPKGRLEGPFLFRSKILAGTERLYWVFVPAQYDPESPAGVLVFQDGHRATNPKGVLRIDQVMENLIGRGEMPVSIGIFITPGHLGEPFPKDLGWGNPNNRAAEYDAMSDAYSRFIVDEMLPEVGKRYRLSEDPEKRCIGGTSSGAICAFTVAWHRPDQFRKVVSFIGSYVSIGFRPNESPPRLGGQDYPALIRREPIRPIRMFMQDGTNDLDNEWGNWFLANQQMLAALDYANKRDEKLGSLGARYEIEAVWTDGAHSDSHGGALLPEALRWLYSE